MPPCPFINILFLATSLQEWQSWGTTNCTKPKIFTIWSIAENVCLHLSTVSTYNDVKKYNSFKSSITFHWIIPRYWNNVFISFPAYCCGSSDLITSVSNTEWSRNWPSSKWPLLWPVPLTPGAGGVGQHHKYAVALTIPQK